MTTPKKILIPILAGAATWGITSLVMKAVFASQPGGLRDCGACLGLLFWLGLPIVVLVQTARALHRSDEADRERELERGEFGGCVLLAALLVGLWMVVVSASEGWSSDPLYFGAVIVAIPVLWLTVSSLVARRRERRRIRENVLASKRKREEIEYRNTHCPACNATDIESKTDVRTYETTEVESDYVLHHDSDDRYTGYSEYLRKVPATKREYTTWLTCKQCREIWREEKL